MRRLFLYAVSLICLFPMYSLADAPGPTLNPYRAYPPSCLSLPLPNTTYGPAITGRYSAVVEQGFGSEDVAISFWRVTCSDGASALVGQISRDSANRNVSPAPLFPSFVVSQGNIQKRVARVALEPNTELSNIAPGTTTIANSATFVFENFADATQAKFNYALQVTISAVPVRNGVPVVGFATFTGVLPPYDPSKYPDATLPLQISGYLSGNYFDPAHSGEGIQIEIGEQPRAPTRYITLAWYTFDSSGRQFWIFGQGNLDAGDRSVTVQMNYSTGGGGFAGNFGSNAAFRPWGSVEVNFPDCNTMAFSYAATSGIPADIPQGSGNKIWSRVTSINGVVCQ